MKLIIFLLCLSCTVYSQIKVKVVETNVNVQKSFAENILKNRLVKNNKFLYVDDSNISINNLDISIEYLICIEDFYNIKDVDINNYGFNILFLNPVTAEVKSLSSIEIKNIKSETDFQNKVIKEIDKTLNNFKIKSINKNSINVSLDTKFKISNNLLDKNFWLFKLRKKLYNTNSLNLIDNNNLKLFIEEQKNKFYGFSSIENLKIKNIEFFISFDNLIIITDSTIINGLNILVDKTFVSSNIYCTSVSKQGASIVVPFNFNFHGNYKNVLKDINNLKIENQLKELDKVFKNKEEKIWEKGLSINSNIQTDFDKPKIAVISKSENFNLENNILKNIVGSDSRYELLDRKKSLNIIKEWNNRFAGYKENDEFYLDGILKDIWFIVVEEKINLKNIDVKVENYFSKNYWYESTISIISLKDKNKKYIEKIITKKFSSIDLAFDDYSKVVSEKLRKYFRIYDKFTYLKSYKYSDIILQGNNIGIDINQTYDVFKINDNKLDLVASFDVNDVGEKSTLINLYNTQISEEELFDNNSKIFFLENLNRKFSLDVFLSLFISPLKFYEYLPMIKFSTVFNYYNFNNISVGSGLSFFSSYNTKLDYQLTFTILPLHFEKSFYIEKNLFFNLIFYTEWGYSIISRNYEDISNLYFLAASFDIGFKFKLDTYQSISIMLDNKLAINTNFNYYDFYSSAIGLSLYYKINF